MYIRGFPPGAPAGAKTPAQTEPVGPKQPGRLPPPSVARTGASPFMLESTVFKVDSPRFVIVLGQGRSGSTLILRLLNGVPGVRISGENLRAFDHLRHFADNYRQADRHRHSNFYKLAWAAPCNHEQILGYLRQMVIAMHGPGDLIGFKEIRYGRESYEEFAADLDWLRGLLPGVRFVLNTRDTESCIHSEWWAKDPAASRIPSWTASTTTSAAITGETPTAATGCPTHGSDTQIPSFAECSTSWA